MRRLATVHGCCKCKLTGPRQRNATTSLQDAAEPLHVRLHKAISVLHSPFVILVPC